MRDVHFTPLLPSPMQRHRVMLAATVLLALPMTLAMMLSDALGQGTGDDRRDAGKAAPLSNPAQPDDPFVVPYLAAQAMPGWAGMATPLVVVASPPISMNARPPPPTYVQIAQIPPNATLSQGQDLGNGTWRVPLEALPDLAITLPPDYVGTARLSITAISEHSDGRVSQRTVELDVPVHSPQGTSGSSEHRDRDTARSVEQSANSVTADALALRSLVPKPQPSETASAQKLLKRGDELFAQGDLAGARLFYQRAASGGSAPAALALGRTHDPVVYERLHVRGLSPDPEQAMRWYREAMENGVGEAERPLKELTAWLAAHRK
ncbi:hypothetical protein [Azospirillum sp. sgz302134]